jgi:hypothetical protein
VTKLVRQAYSILGLASGLECVRNLGSGSGHTCVPGTGSAALVEMAISETGDLRAEKEVCGCKVLGAAGVLETTGLQS